MGVLRRWMGRCVSWVRRHPLVPGGVRAGVVGVAVLVVVVVGAGTADVVDRLHAVPAGAVLRAGSVVVTVPQLNQWTAMMSALTGQPAPADKTLVAKTLALNAVMEQAAAARHIVVADKTANDKLTELVEKSYPQGRDGFTSAMAKAGVPMPSVLHEVKLQLAKAQLFAQVTAGVAPPTDQDVAAEYARNQAKMVVPEKRHIRNIAVGSSDTAAQVRARLDHGEDFATVAQQMSIDTQTKNNGGELGTASRDQIADKAFGDAAFAAPPNSVFGPVQSGPGVWSVGQVLEVTPASPLTLAQVRDSLRQEMYTVRKLDAFNQWMSGQLKAADVRYADQYRPADPTGLPRVPALP